MFVCGMVLRCAGTVKPKSGPVTAGLTTTVVHSSKLLINDIKPVHSLIHLIARILTNLVENDLLNDCTASEFRYLAFCEYIIKNPETPNIEQIYLIS